MEQLITTATQTVVAVVGLALIGLAAIVAGTDSRSTIGDDHRR